MTQKEENIFQQALAESVHFSCKTINSNIEKGGIRLSKNQALDLPYISARTLMADQMDIPTDYQANAGKTASNFKVVKAALLDEDLSDQEEEFKQNVLALKPHIQDTFLEPFNAGLDYLNIRLRQLLIPKNGEYISITPISAAGVNYHLNQKVDLLKEQTKSNLQLKKIQTAVFGIGGANPQNVGSLVRAMQRPIVMQAPTLDIQQQQAFYYFYNGFEYTFAEYACPELYDELKEYAIYSLQKNRTKTAQTYFADLDVEAPFSTLQEREKELEIFKNVIKKVLAQGQQVLETLKKVEKQLPSLKALERDSLWSHPSVSLVARGLINPDLQQDESWQREFADHLAYQIIKHHFWVEHLKLKIVIPLSEADAHAFIARKILRILK